MGAVFARFATEEAALLERSHLAHARSKSDILRGLIWLAICDRAIGKYRRVNLVPVGGDCFKLRLPRSIEREWKDLQDLSIYETSDRALRALLWAYPLVEYGDEWVLPSIEYPGDWARRV